LPALKYAAMMYEHAIFHDGRVLSTKTTLMTP